jgi:uncharacterized membrane protein YhiD involved in acid resistance
MSGLGFFHVPGLSESMRLLAAMAIGIVVVAVQRQARRPQPPPAAIEQTGILLCLAGALVMLTVGDSLPRAFGIAGAATLIRFRTPVDDSRDTTALFLLMALGMACGLGLITVALVGTAFVCVCLSVLRQPDPSAQRAMKVLITAEGREFPTSHVSSVFAAHQISASLIQLSHGERAFVSYRALLSSDIQLEEVSAQMLKDGTGIASVTWEAPKKAA